MKIIFLVNQVKTEEVNYDTTLLSYTATAMGHEVYIMQIEDLCYFSCEETGGLAYKAPPELSSIDKFLTHLQHKIKPSKVQFSDVDVIFLRNNPCEEQGERSWAKTSGMIFTQWAARNNILVLNDPTTLLTTNDKMYLQYFPKAIRPRTIISRNKEEIEAFYLEQNKKIILKPLHGSGGQDVFLLDRSTNLNQIVSTINRHGFIIAQEYLPEASAGDVRVIMLNGKILTVDGKYAAMRRVNKKGDIRSNLHVGGKPKKFKMTESVLEICKTIGPKLIMDGMFLVGIDIIGDKVIEINVESPGGLVSMERIEKVNFTKKVIKSIEEKVRLKKEAVEILPNKFLASFNS
ncbi:ATP-grasp domain-containing protein [Belliella sp. DSM 111904]|uniref:Glutathione synthetase n=1 Tax=Belliella filtrata TaxID=2923435 RepID=A0ABS9V2J7_9BACT|nr:ATP-grasp domain-containing protein [Belliella filtrata]MCH7410584.1 ATP-grasp domain-containing protein [Belliella filtrata]